MPFNFGSPLYTPSSRKLLASSRAPLTLMAKSPRSRSGRTLRRRHHAGQQQAQFIEIAAIERKALNCAGVDDASHGGRIGAGKLRVAVTVTCSVDLP